ncbi:hypothetical protein GJAV_G00077050 [Gymnothorax javanicus]|nr:hypothetical protein GJAV_G00077050 [Gymnothorax javanicus]
MRIYDLTPTRIKSGKSMRRFYVFLCIPSVNKHATLQLLWHFDTICKVTPPSLQLAGLLGPCSSPFQRSTFLPVTQLQLRARFHCKADYQQPYLSQS